LRIRGLRPGHSAALAAVLAGTLAICAFAVTALPRLLVRLEGDFLRISVTPHLNFLKDRVLERLKDGASVQFLGQLTITQGPNSLVPEGQARSVARFDFSYDIWERKFAVTKVGERPDLHSSVRSLDSVEATETWCLEHMTIERSLIPPDRPFYVQLDLREEDPQNRLGIVGESGVNITQLIEFLGKPVKGGPKPVRVTTSAPLRLADLRKAGPG
jgi:hypothetical protein